MEQPGKNSSRKKFLLWGGAVLTSLTAFRLFAPSRKNLLKEEKATTVKMLTQDGRLVEIDIDKIPQTRKKIKKSEIPAWVKQKPSL